MVPQPIPHKWLIKLNNRIHIIIRGWVIIVEILIMELLQEILKQAKNMA